MKRRRFLKIASSGITLSPWLEQLVNAAEAKTADIRDLFQSHDPEVLALAQRVFDKCVLEKLQPPVEPLQHTWIRPGGRYYNGQWIWDTMFVVDLLSLLPGQKQVIRDIFQNYWDFQDRWNKDAPEYARDMITVAIKTAPQEVRQFSQIPILAWGVERVYRRSGDQELLKQCLGRLERFHDWSSPAWMTPLPVPTVDRTDKRWKSSAFWRGDVWPPTNYQIATGLAAYGHLDLAADISDKTIANAIKNGISEHYDSVTGKALGVPDNCMSSTLVTMMLDGLGRKHRLKLRDKKPTDKEQ